MSSKPKNLTTHPPLTSLCSSLPTPSKSYTLLSSNSTPRVPIAPSDAIKHTLFASEPLSTKQERQPFNMNAFIEALRVQHPQMTQEDLEGIAVGQRTQKERFLTFQQRDRAERIKPIKDMFPYLSNEELIEILDRESDNIDEIYDKLEHWTYLSDIRRTIAERYTECEADDENDDEQNNSDADEKKKYLRKRNTTSQSDYTTEEEHEENDATDEEEHTTNRSKKVRGRSSPDEDAEDDDDESFTKRLKRTSAAAKKKTSKTTRKKQSSTITTSRTKRDSRRTPATPATDEHSEMSSSETHSALGAGDEEDYVPATKKKRKRATTTTNGKRPKKRLKLDDALSKIKEGEENFEGWSTARIKAYRSIKTNPNAYYYRFNAPGVAQKHGPWDAEEHEIFMKRLSEFDIDTNGTPKWGIFSQGTPGRVGYQCANYYRYLVKKGTIQDPKYVVDKGKLKCLNTRTKDSSSEASIKKKKRTSTRLRSKKQDSDDECDPDLAMQNAESGRTEYVNPLPGFIDYITQDEVVEPALSPYGHVLGYQTWLRILNPSNDDDLQRFGRNQCPFTKKKLSKRGLVRLTLDNIEYYREKIIDSG